MVSIASGRAVAFGLDGLQQRAEMFVAPGDVVYEGMIVGENARRRVLGKHTAAHRAAEMERYWSEAQRERTESPVTAPEAL